MKLKKNHKNQQQRKGKIIIRIFFFVHKKRNLKTTNDASRVEHFYNFVILTNSRMVSF